MPFSTLSPSGCLGTPLPLPHNLHGRADGRTLTSQPKFLGLIGYQICLFAVVLHWRAGSDTMSWGAEFLTWTFNVLVVQVVGILQRAPMYQMVNAVRKRLIYQTVRSLYYFSFVITVNNMKPERREMWTQVYQ